MKVEFELDIEMLAQTLNKEVLIELLGKLDDNLVMDAIEIIDSRHGDWVYLERMAQLVHKLSIELKPEIEEALAGNHISQETYNILKNIQCLK